MASLSSISTSSAQVVAPTDAMGTSPQAGPLPRKRGEFGFEEGVHQQELAQQGTGPLPAMPERHPEDRSPGASTTPAAPPTIATPSPSNTSGPTPPTDASSTHSSGKKSIISFLKPKKTPILWGVRAPTLARFLLQSALLCGTIAGWIVLVVITNARATRARDENQRDGGNPDDDVPGYTVNVFVHVAFAVGALVQVLYLERAVFLIRAERYMHKHPGAILPRTFRLEGPGRRSNDSTLALAPWNRPPLPTYAAALRDGGHGTGDVEDSQIAVPPPPAYGKTRGSTMLLSGFMNTELRAQARAARGSQISELSDRPVSYMSHDPVWDECADASRERRLEHTLARLEDGERSRRSSQLRASATAESVPETMTPAGGDGRTGATTGAPHFVAGAELQPHTLA